MMKYIKGRVFRIVFSLLILFGQEASCNVFTVVNTFDNVLGSLRRAMLNANAVPGKDTIDFNIPGSQWQIILLTELPLITDSVFIDGLSQPGSSFATSNLVELVGNSNLDYGIDIRGFNIKIVGLKINKFTTGCAFFKRYSPVDSIGNITLDHIIVDSCDYVTFLERKSVKGLTISNCLFSNWNYAALIINLRDNSENIVLSANRFQDTSTSLNYGVLFSTGESHFDSTINVSIVNNIFDSVKHGISLEMGGHCELINVENNSFYNLNGTAINLSSGYRVRANIKHSTIHSNLIDSTCAGSSGFGIVVGSASSALSMDSVEIYNNVVLTSGTEGIRIMCGPSQNDVCRITNISIYDNLIKYSYFGLRYNFRIGNGNCFLANINAFRNEISNCTITGLFFDAGYISSNALGSKIQFLLMDSNYIHDNGRHGINLDAWSSALFVLKGIQMKGNIIRNNVGNGIHIFTNRVAFDGLKFTQNSIFDNGGKGIVELDWQNVYLYGMPKIPAPQFDSLLYNGSKGDLYGHLQSLPNTVYKIEFFSSVNIDTSGYGEGETYLFTRRIVTDSTGHVNFHFSLPQSSIGLYISATVTDSLINHTSEFSNAINNIISGVNDIEGVVNSFTVFPNPANTYTTLQRAEGSQEVQVGVFDITGRIVKKLVFPKGVVQIQINLSSIEEGVYILKDMKAKNKENGVKLMVAKP